MRFTHIPPATFVRKALWSFQVIPARIRVLAALWPLLAALFLLSLHGQEMGLHISPWRLGIGSGVLLFLQVWTQVEISVAALQAVALRRQISNDTFQAMHPRGVL